MDGVSRREVLKSLAATTASLLTNDKRDALVPAKIEPSDGAEAVLPDHPDAADKLLHYFSQIAPSLLRGPEGILEHPWISISLPQKQYSGSSWDWDTLFITRGLFALANINGDRTLHENVCVHAKGSLLNFLDHQSEEGRIPIMMLTDNPDPFGCLKMQSPHSQNQAKPVMAQLALLVADETRDVGWLAPYFDRILHFFEAWILENEASIGLLVWGDDVAIGTDNDPTTFGRPFFSSANIMLNCLFYQDLRACATLAHRLNRFQDEVVLSKRANDLAARIQQYCWDPRDRFYYTVDVQCVDRRAELIPGTPLGMAMSWRTLPLRIQMFTGFLPLWCELATKEQARELVQTNYIADDRFRAKWGVRSLSVYEPMYSLAFSSNPSNWLGPVWILVNYYVWKGLRNYGFHAEAADLAEKTIALLTTDISATGSLNEYYDPNTGHPLSHDGFVDWNMLVLEMMREHATPKNS